MKLCVYCLSICLICIQFACRQDNISFDSDLQLEFSEDTLQFDTVFAQLGSDTRFIKIYNRSNSDLIIEKAYLKGISGDQFNMNIDGNSGNYLTNIRVRAKDSIYVFAEVTIDPNAINTPFILIDSLVLEYNGNQIGTRLEAFGQNANYIFPDTEICNATWDNTKPYFLVGNVEVDSNCSLTILPGTRIVCYTGANLIVSGQVRMLGNTDNRITFEGHRLEAYFNDLPGQWGNIIILRGAKPSEIEYVTISEATSGLIIGSSRDTSISLFNASNLPSATIRNTIIRNTASYGIFSFFADTYIENTLVYGTGDNALAVLFGGSCTIQQSSFLGYGQYQNKKNLIGSQQESVLLFTDFAIQNKVEFTHDLNFIAQNSVFYGNATLDDPQKLKKAGEIQWELLKFGTSAAQFKFENCFIKTIRNTDTTTFVNCIVNTDPNWVKIQEENYMPAAASPLINIGNSALTIDVFGKARIGKPDLGAVEAE